MEYISFYSFVDDNIDKVVLINFSDIVNNTENTIDFISESINNINFKNHEDINSLKNNVENHIKEYSKKYGAQKTISLPTQKRETKKNEIKNKLIEIRLFHKSMNIYNKLKKLV